LKDGLKTYFEKYSFKNTELKDFIGEMCEAAKNLGLNEVNIETWAGEWLNSAGCSEIGLDYDVQDGIIKSMNVNQTLYGCSSLNRLRTQKF
jgi:aminopeptidase N